MIDNVKSKTEFIEMIRDLLDEGFGVYVALSFPVSPDEKPYMRSFPILSIEEVPGGYQCMFQGFGIGEVKPGTQFFLVSPGGSHPLVMP
jgi:hypothetical protein